MKLGELVTFKTGKLNSNAAYENGKYPFFTCSQQTFRTNTYSFDCEAVLLGGNNANGVYPLKYFRGKFDAYQRTYIVCAKDQDILLNRYLYYALRLKLALLQSHSSGVTTKFLTLGILSNIELLLPEKAIQKRIISILSAYDDLIENNTRRIKILEEMAQAIYQEWFVKFRFPGHEKVRMVDSPLGKIPEGWEVVRVESLVKRVKPGKLYSQKIAKPKGKVPILDQGRSGIIGYHNDEPGVNASPENPIIVFANHTCYQRLILHPFSAIQNVLPFLPAHENCRNIYWLHWATKDIIEFNDYKGHWPEFMNKRLLLPPSRICDEFGDIVQPMVKTIYKYEQKNQILRQTRDLLLPKLISGEIDVEDLDIDVGELAE